MNRGQAGSSSEQEMVAAGSRETNWLPGMKRGDPNLPPSIGRKEILPGVYHKCGHLSQATSRLLDVDSPVEGFKEPERLLATVVVLNCSARRKPVQASGGPPSGRNLWVKTCRKIGLPCGPNRAGQSLASAPCFPDVLRGQHGATAPLTPKAPVEHQGS